MITITARKQGPAIAQILIAFLAAIGGLCLYWLYEPAPVGFYHRDLLTPRVMRGGDFKLQIRVFWTKGCYSKLYRNLIDANGTITPFEREVRWNKAGEVHFDVAARVPYNAALGPARWEVRTEWFCNPIQYKWPRSVDLDPIPFEIVEKER